MPARTRLSESGFGLPTPSSRRSSGSAVVFTPPTIDSGPRVCSGITPMPSSMRRVWPAAWASAASPSVAPG
jgi:hypothetical protein